MTQSRELAERCRRSEEEWKQLRKEYEEKVNRAEEEITALAEKNRRSEEEIRSLAGEKNMLEGQLRSAVAQYNELADLTRQLQTEGKKWREKYYQEVKRRKERQSEGRLKRNGE